MCYVVGTSGAMFQAMQLVKIGGDLDARNNIVDYFLGIIAGLSVVLFCSITQRSTLDATAFDRNIISNFLALLELIFNSAHFHRLLSQPSLSVT